MDVVRLGQPALQPPQPHLQLTRTLWPSTPPKGTAHKASSSINRKGGWLATLMATQVRFHQWVFKKKTWGWNTAHINTTRENVGKKQHSRLLLVMLQRSAPKLGHASPANIFWGDIKGCKWGSRWSGSTPLAPKPPQKKGELKNPAKKWKWKWRYGCVPASKSWPSLAKSFFNNLGPATHTGFQSDTRPKKEPPTEASWTNCG